MWQQHRRGLALLNADRTARNYQVYPAILCSSSGRRIVCDGIVHAIAGRGDVGSGDALRNEIVAHRIASLLRKRQVVLISTYVVGVSLDLHFQIWIGKKNPRYLSQLFPGYPA